MSGKLKRVGRYGGKIKKHRHEDGTVLDSKREYNRYCELLLLQRAGEIKKLEVHPRFPIEVGGIKIMMRSPRYPNGRQLTYVADFKYFEKNPRCEHVWEPRIEDVKMQSGYRTREYKIKRALMEAMGYTIREY